MMPGTKRAGKVTAVIVVATVEVHCPHCGDPQPNPDNGAFSWMPSEVEANQGARKCVACDEPFKLHAQSRMSA